MASRIFANNVAGLLASTITGGATSLPLVTGQGALFPSPTGGDYYLLTLTQGSPPETSWEIVKVTARTDDTLTIVRGQEGTAATSWAGGSKVDLRFTAGIAAPLEAPASASRDGYLSSTDWSAFNGKQAAGTYATGTGSASNTNTGDNAPNSSITPTSLGLVIGTDVLAQRTFGSAANSATTDFDAAGTAAALVVGLWDDRGSFDASVNTYPTTGGSGTAGAILKGDIWTVSVVATSGVLNGYAVGTNVRAVADTPGQTGANWAITEVGLGYTPENSANKVTTLSGSSTDTQYPSAKLVFDRLAGKAASGNVAPDTHAATNKATPVDSDEFGIADSAATYGLKHVLWSAIKTTLGFTTDILGSAFGGTGNGWTKFTGPTTSEKTFTLPNASASLAILGANTFTGNQTLGENTALELDPVLSADGKYTGIVQQGTAAAALAFGELCYRVTATGKWNKASGAAANVNTVVAAGQLGMCVLAAAGDASATTMLLYGNIRADALFDSFTVGAPVYMSAATAGKIVSAKPTGTTDFTVRALGFAEDANTVFFSPSPDYITLS